jgi:alpha-glucoside transport system permease protein
MMVAVFVVIFLVTYLLALLLYPSKDRTAGHNISQANMVRPWLFLFPAIFALGLYLAYPVFETLRLSLPRWRPSPNSGKR